MRIRFGRAIVFILALVIVVPFPAARGGEKKTGTFIVITTSTPYRAYAKIVLEGIPGVSVETLIPEGADPHSFSLTPATLPMLKKAAFIVGNGRAEDFIDFARLKKINPRARLLLTFPLLDENISREENLNPHTWVNPTLASKEIEIIGKALSDMLPRWRSVIAENVKNARLALHEAGNMGRKVFGRKHKLGVILSHDGLDELFREFDIPIIDHVQKRHGVPPSPGEFLETVKRGRNFPGKVVVVVDNPGGAKAALKVARLIPAPIVTIRAYPPSLETAGELARWIGKNLEIVADAATMK